MIKRTVICNHPNIYPTQWEQKRPEPTEVQTCDCGKNWCCPVCGYGVGCYPCECHKKIIIEPVVESSIKENASIWSKLAGIE